MNDAEIAELEAQMHGGDEWEPNSDEEAMMDMEPEPPRPASKRNLDVNGFVDAEGGFKKAKPTTESDAPPSFSFAGLGEEDVLGSSGLEAPNVVPVDSSDNQQAGPAWPDRPASMPHKYSSPPTDCPYVEIVSSVTADTLFVPLKSARNKVVPKGVAVSAKDGLLAKNMEQLMTEAAQNRSRRQTDPSAAMEMQMSAPDPEACVWSEKYRASHYIDLVSEGSVNRRVLSWVKQWDPAVFGGAVQKRPKAWNEAAVDEGMPHQDETRPEQKVLLLVGPPGGGKTTLAHVIARHAGYEPYEINASADRSEKALRSKIADATEMKAMFGSCKPNCIILDEIDGAVGGTEGKGAIRALVQIVQAGSTAPSGDDSKKKVKKVKKLQRPIICLCNDMYVPALYPLRDVAMVVKVDEIEAARLTLRLQQITSDEGVSVDRQVLSQLADGTGKDIRSCINTLQFASRLNSKRITAQMIQQIGVGQKDRTKGIFDVWEAVFGAGGHKEKGSRCDRLYSMVSFGEKQKVFDGIHDNLLHAKLSDPLMEGASDSLDWLAWADQMDTHMSERMDMSLGAYSPFAVVGVAAACSCPIAPEIRYPRAAQQAAEKQRTARNVVDGMIMAMSASVCSMSKSNICLDLLSLLCKIVQPIGQRAPNPSADETRELIGVMLQFGLSWKAGWDNEGGSGRIYSLEPPIHSISQFEFESDGNVVCVLSDSRKQLISHETELQRLRQFSSGRGGSTEETAVKTMDQLQAYAAKKVAALKDVQVDDAVPARAHVSIMGFVKRTSSGAVKQPSRLTNTVKYKFKEGFSAAVRRKVYLKDFF